MRTPIEITLATIDLSFHRAASGVVKSILRRHGVEVREIVAPHEQAFELLSNGGADMLCSAWLPASHDLYFAPVEDAFEKLTVLYHPYALWGVPDYVPSAEVRCIDDLRKPGVAARMLKLIQGIGPGAGISRFSREIVEQYDLAQFGYHFENGTLDDCVKAFESAVAGGKWVVVPLWKPQFLHEKYRIRELDDPLDLLGGKDEATLVIRKTLVGSLPEDAIEELRSTCIGNAEVARLDYELLQP